jgi:hypothetical protein
LNDHEFRRLSENRCNFGIKRWLTYQLDLQLLDLIQIVFDFHCDPFKTLDGRQQVLVVNLFVIVQKVAIFIQQEDLKKDVLFRVHAERVVEAGKMHKLGKFLTSLTYQNV